MSFVEHLRSGIEFLPMLAKFAIGMVLIIVVPKLARRIRLPETVGLLLTGVVFGPYVLDVFPRDHPVAQFFSELGMLLLMFFAGLEINLALLRQQIRRSVVFGVATTSLPLLLGTLVTLWLGYGLLAAIVVGSLLASHTLLGSTIVAGLGLRNSEPFVVTVGATMMSDILSLLVFAICAPLYASGFSASALVVQAVGIVAFVPLVLFGLGRVAAYCLRKVEDEEENYFIVMLVILAGTAMLAQLVNLPGIVGSFLAGGLIGALVIGKWLAPEATGRAFGCGSAARKTVWSLTLPQLAATLVATKTVDAAGVPLIDGRILNSVLVMVLVTAIVGPVLTQRFAPRMLESRPGAGPGIAPGDDSIRRT